MNRYALIADVHANLEALRSVLADIQAQSCSHIACLGDIVGCHNHPKECLDLIRGANIPCLKGDYDEYCSTDIALDGFNREAANHILWTRSQLSESDRQWLRELPYQREMAGFLLVHASQDRPQRWACVLETDAATAQMARQKHPVCFFGHTHKPVVYIKKEGVHELAYAEFKVDPETNYLVNVGSVGEAHPQGSRSLAAYAIYDLDAQTITLRQVEYQMAPEPPITLPSTARLETPVVDLAANPRIIQPVNPSWTSTAPNP